VLHSEWWVRAHWGRAFDVLAIEDGLPNEEWVHSWALLRPRPGALGTTDLERPEPGESREVEALRHNIRQLQREMERAVRETQERAASEAAALYERSASWRLTRPLRAVRARIGRPG
jgi:hypothetical protein